jgi:hypothetical protein
MEIDEKDKYVVIRHTDPGVYRPQISSRDGEQQTLTEDDKETETYRLPVYCSRSKI